MASAHGPHPKRLTTREYMQRTEPVRLFVHHLRGHIDVHWHEFFELGFVTSGEGKQVLNGTTFPLRKGTLFLLTPADFHELSPASDEPYVHYNLIFSDDAIAPDVRRHLFAHGQRNWCCQLPDDRFESISADFERIRAELDQPHAVGADTIVQGTLARLLLELVRQADAAAPRPDRQESSVDQGIRNALAFVQMRFRDAPSLEDAARQANLSPNYFSRCFRHYTGMTYQRYLQELRLQFAGSLIRMSDLPITEICYASGFNTLPHFERAFKTKFGCSPRTYRSST